jgi:hypothetical protein
MLAGAAPEAPERQERPARTSLLSRFAGRHRPAPAPFSGPVGKPQAGYAAPPPKAERTADKTAKKDVKAEAAPRDADEPWDRRESSALFSISQLRANVAPEPAQPEAAPEGDDFDETSAGSIDISLEELVAASAPRERHTGGRPEKLPVAVARSVGAVERSATAMGGAALRARSSWLSRFVVLVILAIVIAALWWFVR